MRTASAAIALALVALLLAPAVSAGSAEAPEVSDPAGDMVVSGGTPLQPLLDAAGQGDAFGDVDVLAAWFADDGTNVTLTVRSTAAVQDATATNLTFTVGPGPDSQFGSTASNATVTVRLTGTTVDVGPDGATATASDADLVVVMPRSALGAVGGDILGDLVVERSRSTDGTAGVAPGQDATDRAPDTGSGAPYTLGRPETVPGVSLTVVSIDVAEGANTRHVSGTAFSTTDPQANLTITVRLTNTGTDADTVALAATATDGTPTVEPAAFSLDPGASATATVGLRLDTGGAATVDLSMVATSGRGAVAAQALTVTVAPLPPIKDPAPEQTVEETGRLAWLTPAAEALGFDQAFGDHAEAVLLALLVFLAALLVALVWWLLGRRRRPEPGPADEPVQHPGALDVLIGQGEPLGEVAVPGLHLQQVGHSPSDPQDGQDVTTTLVLRNELSQGLKARVRMTVDDYVVLDQVVALLVKGRIRLRVPWTAGDGANRVHIQVLPA